MGIGEVNPLQSQGGEGYSSILVESGERMTSCQLLEQLIDRNDPSASNRWSEEVRGMLTSER